MAGPTSNQRQQRTECCDSCLKSPSLIVTMCIGVSANGPRFVPRDP